ncbi:MAG TPA: mechanosensitive ion channel domain-containing protein [Steroidobacteraceae bacterium]|nr:mechanosensitive ion channel domain-containing protein [Steroidobacteraceae bacterium]
MIRSLSRATLLLLAGLPHAATGTAPPNPAPPAAAAAAAHVSPLSAEQLVQILDQTVDWYRTLGLQQQSATQPSDLLLLYANQQTADEVVRLAFQIARANAELLSSEASSRTADATADRSPQKLEQLERDTAQRSEALQKQMDSVRRTLATAPARTRSNLEARLAELQSELAMLKAQQNLFDTMTQFVDQNDAQRANVSALKARIDAIAATIPAATAANGAPTAAVSPSARGTAATGGSTTTVTAQTSGQGAASSGELGILDLFTDTLRLAQKLSTIDAVDQRTKALQDTFHKIRAAPAAQLQALSAQSDRLASAAASANGAELQSLRDQFDTLAWLFTQTSAIALPLSKEAVLLTQYRDNLDKWRSSVSRQYHQVLRALWMRIAVLVGALLAVFAGSEFWRRTVLRYVLDPRRRNQLLLARRIVTWFLVLVILGLTFITHLSSFATFAGLLTAGLAVAMQSVLVSVVGYFILIGKYGLRVGDRVQVGGVTGEVIDLGLIRMHLLELTSQEPLGPTGRVVAFANSIVFQSSGGLFKQIPGVNFTWRELTLTLPAGSDYLALKDRLLAAVTSIVEEYRGEIVRQAETITQTTALPGRTDLTAQVQLQFTPSGAEARVRYPVPLNRTAQIDERVSQTLHQLLQQARPSPAGAARPA